jgi:hypothetical protein
VVAGRAGAALTKPGRPGTARWGGSGERGGKEYARNRRYYVLHLGHRLKPGGYGPGAARTAAREGGGNFREVDESRTGRPWGRPAAARDTVFTCQLAGSGALSDLTTISRNVSDAQPARRARQLPPARQRQHQPDPIRHPARELARHPDARANQQPRSTSSRYVHEISLDPDSAKAPELGDRCAFPGGLASGRARCGISAGLDVSQRDRVPFQYYPAAGARLAVPQVQYRVRDLGVSPWRRLAGAAGKWVAVEAPCRAP